VDRLRRTALGVEVLAPGRGAPEPDAPVGARAEGVAAARQALGRLAARMDARTLEVLVLARFDRMTHEEVAGVIGLSSRQVRRILDEAERELARMVKTAEMPDVAELGP
jgi:DNA-directed RNA polymerase specialized sigma24 family protein